MSHQNEPPLYLAMYKLEKHLHIVTKHFPKEYKYTLGESIKQNGWETLEAIMLANTLPNHEKQPIISNASLAFDKLTLKLRMSYELKLISHKRYAFLIIQTAEIGNMISGWLRWSKACKSSNISP